MTIDLVLDADDREHRRDSAGDTRFVLKQASSMEWVLIDTTVPRGAPARVVACVYEYDRDDYGVVCLGDIELRAEYGSLEEIVEDACRAVLTSEDEYLLQ